LPVALNESFKSATGILGLDEVAYPKGITVLK
jgi:hypothetical protein